MKKKWLIVLSLTGVLALSGTALAYASQVPNNSSQGEPNNGLPGYGYGYGMMGGYGGFGNSDSNWGYSSGGNNEYGYGMMGGYGGYANGNNSGDYGCGFGGNGRYGYGMMGGFFNGSQTGLSIKGEKNSESDMTSSLADAKIDNNNNTITYTGTDVKIVMLGGPENADGKFVIGGLVNPTLKIPKGSNVTLELINEDEGMPHGVEITTASPPYNYMSMMDGGIYPGTLIPPLPEGNDGQYSSAQTSFAANGTGTSYYICQYPGHAQKGMYGKIIIQ